MKNLLLINNFNDLFDMKNSRPYRKFQFQQKKIQELEQNNNQFKRMYTEYECMSEELWDLENEEKTSVTDDFLDSFGLQTNYLEEQIEHWLQGEEQ